MSTLNVSEWRSLFLDVATNILPFVVNASAVSLSLLKNILCSLGDLCYLLYCTAEPSTQLALRFAVASYVLFKS